jgi:hypothetical protein
MSARRLAVLACVWMLLGSGTATATVATRGGRALSYPVLIQGRPLAAPVATSEYAAAPDARAASLTFMGRLSFAATGRSARASVLRDTYALTAGVGRSLLHLPAFDFEFVQSGDALIPVRRGSVPSDDPDWEYILEPGRVWEEPGDRGFARAALPFALEERNANCVHHGVLTFLFDAQGTVSQVAYQIGSETCMYLQFDLWGLTEARYTPGRVPAAASVVSAYEQEVRSRLPVKPMTALSVDYPGADAAAFGAPQDIAPGDMSAFGFLVDGVHYAGACGTRYGPYPFCDVLDLPSYSLAKSIFASVALMRLEQRLPGASRREIPDFVPECARAGTWQGVTFGNTLDMATGNFRSPQYDVDEEARHTAGLFETETHARKIQYACGEYPRKAPPGKQWVYHTSDTYVLGTALNAFVRQNLGAERDVFTDVLLGELWQPLGLSPVTQVTRRTLDAAAQPFTGWGLVLHRDDILRIGQWLATDHGVLAGRQMLDPQMLAAALQRVPQDRGLTSTGADFRYQHGFWAHDVSRDIGCGHPAWVPFMSGYGGIVVALFPNDTIYYYFSDGGTFNWRRAAIEANRIRSFCTRPPGAGTPPS